VFPNTYSKLSTYGACARKFWLLYGSKHVDGKAIIPFQSSPALEKGNKIHENMETTIKLISEGLDCTRSNLPYPDLCHMWWAPMVEKLLANCKNHSVEQKLAFSPTFEKVVIADKYWNPYRKDSKVVFRGKLDLALFNGLPIRDATEATIVDWKSGQVRKSTEEMCQLASQAMLLFISIPELQKVTASYVWLEHKKRQTKVFKRCELPKMKEVFGNQFKLIERKLAIGEDGFPADGQGNCHWCPATKEMCQYAK
jgi:hypothetical protein